MRFRAILNFLKFKVALNPMYRIALLPEVIGKRLLVLVLAFSSVRRQLGEIINTRTVQSTFNQINVTLYLLRKN